MKNFAEIERDFVRANVLPDFDFVHNEEPSPLNPLNLPVTAARVALISTGGAYLKHSDAPFDLGVQGDPSYREIPAATRPAELALCHVGYDTGRSERDVDVVFPLQRLRELRRSGAIGEVAPRHFSFMGYAPQVEVLELNAVEVGTRLQADEVDLALLVPA